MFIFLVSINPEQLILKKDARFKELRHTEVTKAHEIPICSKHSIPTLARSCNSTVYPTYLLVNSVNLEARGGAFD
jgi:hypothetical protein